MGSMKREMAIRPPRGPLDTLGACIDDFLWRREPGGGLDVLADDIPAMCAEAETFVGAVYYAVSSYRRNGKMHPHQTKVKREAREEFGRKIVATYAFDTAFARRQTFDVFYDRLWGMRPAGIGPLTVYDVATRLGGYVKIEPEQLYMHTGAKLGWDAMWNHCWNYRDDEKIRIHPNAWPPQLRQLKADLAEDFLCAYRGFLERIKRDEYGNPI